MSSASAVSVGAVGHRRFRWRGGIGVLLLVPATLVTAFSTPLLAEDSLWQIPVHAAGWACFLAGAGMRFWATLYIGGRKETELVTGGPYSLCRNPLYLGSLLLGIAAGLLLESTLFLLALTLLWLAYGATSIPVEEQVLARRHGTAFAAYASRVPRWIPSWEALRTPARLSVHVPSLWTECARACRWLWLPIVCDALLRLKVQPWWPTFFHRL